MLSFLQDDSDYGSTLRETVVVALWGPHAHQFPAEALQQQLQQGPVVILFVALTVKLYEGDIFRFRRFYCLFGLL
jgi:hypothetical protein